VDDRYREWLMASATIILQTLLMLGHPARFNNSLLFDRREHRGAPPAVANAATDELQVSGLLGVVRFDCPYVRLKASE
jgi:hypothetical protein